MKIFFICIQFTTGPLGLAQQFTDLKASFRPVHRADVKNNPSFHLIPHTSDLEQPRKSNASKMTCNGLPSVFLLWKNTELLKVVIL